MIEIDIKRGFLVGLVLTLLCVGLVISGYLVSPNGDDGLPLLLSPRLSQMKRYQREAQRWYTELSAIHHDMTDLIAGDSGDLFAQNNLINKIYGRLAGLESQMDQAAVPPTLTNLHALMMYTTQAHQDAAILIAQWLSEPTASNQEAVYASLEEASDALEQIYDNPWVREGVEENP